jgi:glycosyltransferase involved in cell wall biosynthesis
MIFKQKTRIKGKLSVVLPTYNRCNFVEKAIEKILNNNYSDLELIVVNDCSTDKTNDLLSQYKQDNIKIINLNENSGTVSIPRNIGISYCTGEYISHADDDVSPMKNKFSILTEILNKNQDAILAYGNRINRYLGSNQETYHKLPNWNPLINTGVDNGDFIYRSNVYDSIPLIWAYRGCDFELAKKIYNLGKFVHIDEFVSIYIWHGDNRSIITNEIYSKFKTMDIPEEKYLKFKKYMNL